MLRKFILFTAMYFLALSAISQEQKSEINIPQQNIHNQLAFTKPGVLWWWFADRIKQEDVKYQVDWLKENNIGDVLIFYLYPLNRNKRDTVHYTPRYEFAGKDFSDIAVFTKKYCDSKGMSCNFLFGSGWPFGGTFVSKDDASLSWTKRGIEPMRTFGVSWDWPKHGYVIDHLSKASLDKYFDKVGAALQPATVGSKSYFECDSWEIAEFEPIWTKGFDKMFQDKFHYDITPYVSQFVDTDKKDSLFYKISPYTASIYDRNDKSLFDIRYDYYNLVSELVLNNFYRHFTKRCNAIGAGSVVECCGTPADIIDAYASIDLPSTEAMLYEPNYSKIPASAVTLSGKNILTSETFTCAYGFKDKFGYKEQIADMKLVADEMFANGVNHISWHGYPLNPKGYDTVKYYATVNVGPKSKLMKGFKEFNAYMQKVSEIMQRGSNLTEIAVYLPMEDRWAEGVYSQDFLNKLRPEERYWHFSKYQMRYEYFPEELNGYPMLWINSSFIENAKIDKQILNAGSAEFKALYINVNYMQYKTLCRIVEFAKQGLTVCLKNDLKEPGTLKHKDYNSKLAELKALKNVSNDFHRIYKAKPLIEGSDLPHYWCRRDNKDTYIYFANPKTKQLKYPVAYGQSLQKADIVCNITLNLPDIIKSSDHQIVKLLDLVFKPYQSIVVKIDRNKIVSFENISFIPEQPQIKAE